MKWYLLSTRKDATKNANKTTEDSAEVDVEIVESLSPFVKQLLEKLEMNEAMTEISKNVS